MATLSPKGDINDDSAPICLQYIFFPLSHLVACTSLNMDDDLKVVPLCSFSHSGLATLTKSWWGCAFNVFKSSQSSMFFEENSFFSLLSSGRQKIYLIFCVKPEFFWLLMFIIFFIAYPWFSAFIFKLSPRTISPHIHHK